MKFPEKFDWQPLILSLQVASVALVFTFIAGTFAAFWMTRRHFRGRDWLDAVFLLPLVLPPVVTGYVLLLLIGRRGIVGSWLQNSFETQLLFTPLAAVLASSVVAFPLMYGCAKAAFSQVDNHLQDAARSLGAGKNRVFWTITIPLSWTGLVAGAVLTFARALGEFGATIMVAGNIEGRTITAPSAIYNATESGDLRTAGIYALLVGLINLVFVVGLNVWLRRSQRVK